MNTEREYQLIKNTYKIIKNAENPHPRREERKKYREWEDNNCSQMKTLNFRLFVLNLNLRPNNLPTELMDIIKHKALMTEIKKHRYFKPVPEKFDYSTPYDYWGSSTQDGRYGCMGVGEDRSSLINILYELRSSSTKVYKKLDDGPNLTALSKKQYLEYLFKQSGKEKEFKKSYTVKKLNKMYLQF